MRIFLLAIYRYPVELARVSFLSRTGFFVEMGVSFLVTRSCSVQGCAVWNAIKLVVMKPMKKDPAESPALLEWSSAVFVDQVAQLKATYLNRVHYQEKIGKALYPLELMKSVRKDLERFMRLVEEKEELRDAYTEIHPYATTVIHELLRNDERIRDFFQAVQIYCLLRERDLAVLAPLLVQFQAYFQLHQEIGLNLEEFEKNIKIPCFIMEVRKRDSRAPYVKVFFRRRVDLTGIATILSRLSCIRAANPGSADPGQCTLFLYPFKGSSIEAVETIVTEALTAYFEEKL